MGYVCGKEHSCLSVPSSSFNIPVREICPHGDSVFCIDESGSCCVLELTDANRTVEQSKRVHVTSCALSVEQNFRDQCERGGKEESGTFASRIEESNKSRTDVSSERTGKCSSGCAVFKRLSSGDSHLLAVAGNYNISDGN